MSYVTYHVASAARRKPLVWLHGEVKSPPFSAGARIEVGALMRQLQEGSSLSLPHSRPMPGIGRGCHEIRVQDEERAWRLVYLVDADAIVILDVFSKTTSRTPKSVIDTCRARLKRFHSTQREVRP